MTAPHSPRKFARTGRSREALGDLAERAGQARDDVGDDAEHADAVHAVQESSVAAEQFALQGGASYAVQVAL